MSGAYATTRASHRAGPGRQSRRPIKLMIVDDSMVARAVLSRMIDADSNFEISGIAGTAEDAIEGGQVAGGVGGHLAEVAQHAQDDVLLARGDQVVLLRALQKRRLVET